MEMNVDVIYNKDCIEGLKELPDSSIDLVVMDPPYEMDTSGGGAFGSFNKLYHSSLPREYPMMFWICLFRR